MVRSLLISGMIAGCLAGVIGFIFARVVGEPPVNAAIAFESYVEYTAHQGEGEAEPEEELVSRGLQSSSGLGTGVLIYGAAIGGVFALIFTAVYGRLQPFAARGTAALLGCLGFIAIYLVPFLKYPANPPSVGDPDTIGYRTSIYIVMVLASIAAMVLAVMLQQRLARTMGGWNATMLAGGVYVLVMVFCGALMPNVNEVPQQALTGVIGAVTNDDVTFPPTVLWAFRVSSLGLQVVIWSALALLFGALAERQLEQPQKARQGIRLVGAQSS